MLLLTDEVASAADSCEGAGRRGHWQVGLEEKERHCSSVWSAREVAKDGEAKKCGYGESLCRCSSPLLVVLSAEVQGSSFVVVLCLCRVWGWHRAGSVESDICRRCRRS
ncbi:hypothetical protein Vretimale_8059 [Volvox reticuliferus]|uniref:Uncharacterized protein n=1 Tax=Volvox reticuliferus TaxID=1737510 RepID=A0A8J4GAH5_9CHLO|nr:hypothetical protein Vretimale_8059 [Volvox reticuliferus]